MTSRQCTLLVAGCVSVFAAACSSKKSDGGAVTDSAAVTTAVAAGSATATPSAATPATQSATLPKSVTTVGEHGEDLYDAVSASNWRSARAILDSLDQSASLLPNDSSIRAEHAQLPAVLDSLHRAVAARQRIPARSLANRVTYLTSMMNAPYNPVTPADVLLLDYYGRELEIWSSRQNDAELGKTVGSIRKTWSEVRPAVESHGGTAAAAKMEQIVKRLEAAKNPQAYAATAKPFLDQVDELEKVFAKP